MLIVQQETIYDFLLLKKKKNKKHLNLLMKDPRESPHLQRGAHRQRYYIPNHAK